MATLTGQTIASTYDALLKVTDNGPITSSLKLITDGLGNNTALSLSNAGGLITGTFSVSSTISASNLSGTNTGDETNATIKTKLGAATTSVDGYLTSTDWNTFNNKQSALTNPITGTGTTNTLPKFTGASALGNSNITDTGTLITLASGTRINGNVGVNVAVTTQVGFRISTSLTGNTTPTGLLHDGVIQSDATSSATYFRTNLNTAASSFTIGTVNHFQAAQVTIGAGSAITTQIGYNVNSSLNGATNNYGFQGQIASGLNNYNLYMSGAAANYIAGDVGIGANANYVSSGPILTTTLTNGGSGYVDGTYTDVASSVLSGVGAQSLYTVVVSGGIVTSATLTWGGSNYRVGDTLTISNTLLGGTGSGLVITAATVDSSQLKISNANGGDITLHRADTSLTGSDNIGSIKFENPDSSVKASGLQARISALGAGTSGGANIAFLTRSITAGTSLVEAMRIGSEGSIGIGATSLSGHSLRISKNITGATSGYGISIDSTIQSDVTSAARMYHSSVATQAASFTLASLQHFATGATTIGAGSTVTNQYGFLVLSNTIGATNNYAFAGQLAAATNTWNLYMNGTANNYMAGSLGIGSTSLTGINLLVSKNLTGATTAIGITSQGQIQSDVTSHPRYFTTVATTQATAFTISQLSHYQAAQGTFGAGSVVTTQTGFLVNSSLIGGTNNYGFRGEIPSATNRWNLYMDGTASNYLNGTTLIGSTTDNGSGAKLQVTGNITFQNAFNRRTASYTLVLTDQNDIVEMNVATANNLTVPLNSSVAFPIGTEIAIMQYGAGQTTIVATGGVTLRAKSGALKISGQYAGCTLVKVGTDEWYVVGDLTI